MNYIPQLECASFKLWKRHKWSPMCHILDMADYNYGYFLSLPGFKVLKFKTSKIMQKEDWIIVISIFGKEIVLR